VIVAVGMDITSRLFVRRTAYIVGISLMIGGDFCGICYMNLVKSLRRKMCYGKLRRKLKMEKQLSTRRGNGYLSSRRDCRYRLRRTDGGFLCLIKMTGCRMEFCGLYAPLVGRSRPERRGKRRWRILT
jgi:hypothetical protein